MDARGALKLKYGLDDRPPPAALLLYGLQWWIVCLACSVNLGVVTARLFYGGDVAGQMFFLQKTFAVMGGAGLAQILLGHRLPLVVGPASVLLVGVIASMGAGRDAVFTAAAIGGTLAAAAGYGGLMSRLRSLFTPRIVAVTLILVALTLGPTIIRLGAGGNDGPRGAVFRYAFLMLLPLALLFVNDRLKGVAKSLTLPLGMAGGSLLYWAATEFPSLAATAGPTAATWTILPELHAGTVLAFLFSFIALLVNELGSVEAVGQMLGAAEMGPRIRRGCGVAGVANVVAGWLGVLGPVDYSLSAGIIPASGCASRFTLVPALAGLILCALFPPLIMVLVSIPGPVLGGIMIYLMGLQIGSGFGILARDGGAGDFNGGVIVGLPVMVGLVVSFSPPEVFAAFPDMLRSIVGNGFVMGMVAVVLLEHVVLRKKRGN